MSVGKALLVASILLLCSLSGCVLFRQTHFSLLFLSIGDTDGFAEMSISFNNSDTIDLSLSSPNKTILFSETFYYGLHMETFILDEYWSSPAPGTYLLRAVDASKNTIYENELFFKGAHLSISSLSADRWTDDSVSSVSSLHLLIKNTGDLPAYPSYLTVETTATRRSELLPPTVVLPSQRKELSCFLPIDDLSDDTAALLVTVEDSNGAVLVQKNFTLRHSASISSWEYSWYYHDSYELSLPAVNWFYEYYKSLDRLVTNDYSAYVFDQYDDSYLFYVASQVLSLKESTDTVERINLLSSFVQNLDYVKDDATNESCEYPRYPLETLQEQRGDCEDKAILAASLLRSMNYTVSLIRLPNHMAVGVHLNQTLPGYSYYIDDLYFLAATTPNMPLGKVPKEYQGLSNVTTYALSSRPLLLHQWRNATRFMLSSGEDFVKLKILINNIGDAAAQSFEMRAAFYDSSNRSYNRETTPVVLLEAGKKCYVELLMKVPSEVSTILRSEIFANGQIVSERESASRFP